MSEIRVVRTTGREDWNEREDPPGTIPSVWRELEIFSSGDGTFTTGLWERDPDTWPFERAYDEVAIILQGSADIETEDGQTIPVRAGDVLVTPKGSRGIWHVHEPIVKFFAIYDA